MGSGAAFHVHAERRGSTAVLHVRGEIDILTCSTVSTALTDALLSGPTRVVVNLSAVEFMGSAGLHALICAVHEADDHGCSLVLVAAPPAVSRVFDLTGTTSLFTWASN